MMARLRFCLSSIFKSSGILPAKDVLASATAASNRRHKAKEKSKGLGILYEDIEACGGYADIQVMWNMIQASAPNLPNNRSKRWLFRWKFT